jgi:hypothetical protein
MFKSDKFTRIYQEIIVLVYNGDRKGADLKVRQAHQDRRITLLAKRNRMSSVENFIMTRESKSLFDDFCIVLEQHAQ